MRLVKLTKHTLLAIAFAVPCALADPAKPEEVARRERGEDHAAAELAEKLEKHAQGSKRLAFEQDELSADVQDLIDEQTDAEVIKLLREIEVVMADATDLLEQQETGGPTIAIETEVIEKIFEAAKKRQEKKDGG